MDPEYGMGWTRRELNADGKGRMPMEGEVEGFMGAMWNGVFYNPGQQAAYNAAVAS